MALEFLPLKINKIESKTLLHLSQFDAEFYFEFLKILECNLDCYENFLMKKDEEKNEFVFYLWAKENLNLYYKWLFNNLNRMELLKPAMQLTFLLNNTSFVE